MTAKRAACSWIKLLVEGTEKALHSGTKLAPFSVRTTDEKGKFGHFIVLNLLVY